MLLVLLPFKATEQTYNLHIFELTFSVKSKYEEFGKHDLSWIFVENLNRTFTSKKHLDIVEDLTSFDKGLCKILVQQSFSNFFN